jgi:hypothetical protein
MWRWWMRGRWRIVIRCSLGEKLRSMISWTDEKLHDLAVVNSQLDCALSSLSFNSLSAYI